MFKKCKKLYIPTLFFLEGFAREVLNKVAVLKKLAKFTGNIFDSESTFFRN